MNLDQIIQVERVASLLEARLCGILDPDIGAGLQNLRFWASEVRHFSVCWDDSVKAQAAGQMDEVQASAYRRASIDRLVQVFRPE